MLGAWEFDFAQQGRKGRERAGIPSRPAERPRKSWQGGATPQSSPLGKKAERDGSGNREEEEKGGPPHVGTGDRGGASRWRGR